MRDFDEFFFRSGIMMGVMAWLLIPLALLGLAIPYAVIRFRDARGESQDPQVGIKCALYFFFSLALLLFETGLTIIVVDLMLDRGRGDFPNEMQRIAGGFVVSGA